MTNTWVGSNFHVTKYPNPESLPELTIRNSLSTRSTEKMQNANEPYKSSSTVFDWIGGQHVE